MCASCVAQGAGYVGAALVALKVMGTRAAKRAGADAPADGRDGLDEDAAAQPDRV